MEKIKRLVKNNGLALLVVIFTTFNGVKIMAMQSAIKKDPLLQSRINARVEQERIAAAKKGIQVLGPIMPQQQLLSQKDVLQNFVKNVWTNCLNALNVKFPDLVDQNQSNGDVVSANFNFEKQPKTDDNILFIKNTVQDIVAKTPILSMKFDQQTKVMQEQALKSLLERVMVNGLIELVLKDISDSLDWCTCIAEYKRITLVLLLVNETREKFPQQNHHLVYTSFAAGNLLLDYLVLSELLLSHTNILVNLIDLEYPDIPALAKKNLSIGNPTDLHMLEMKNKQESADLIDSFKIKIAQIVSEKPTNINYNVEVNVYQNAYEYIAYVQKNPKEKSNILLLVDPSVFVFGIADFPPLANVINVWIDGEEMPVFTIYLPRHHEVHLYQAKANDSPEIMQSLHSQLLSLMGTTGASKNYTPRFVTALLDKLIFDQQITDEVLATKFPQLMDIRAKLKREALEEGYADNDLLNPLTPVELGDVSVLLSWGTDAHISFQDLVWDALAPNAVVYQLYAIDPKKHEDNNNQILKINPEIYKKADVITPNAGAMSRGKVRVLNK